MGCTENYPDGVTKTGQGQRAGSDTKAGQNVDGTGSESRVGHENGPKCGRDGVTRQGRTQKRAEMWTGRGHKAGPDTKTGRNVDGTGAQGRAGHKNGPKCGRDRVREQGRAQKVAEMWTGQGHKAGPDTKAGRNVDGTGSQGRAGHKSGPKCGRDMGTRQGRGQEK